MAEQPEKTAPAPEAVDKAVEPPTETTAASAPVPEAQPEQTPAEPAQKEAISTGQPSGNAPAAEATPEAAPEAEEPAAAAVPEQKDDQPAAADEKPAYLAKNPALSQLFDRLPTILSSSGHDEMWGIPLMDSADVPTVNVLIKFLRANEGNAKLAEEQLTKALEWRKQINPSALVESGRFNASKFGGLGYLTTYQEVDGKELVVTWNIYGAVKSIDDTFGDMDE